MEQLNFKYDQLRNTNYNVYVNYRLGIWVRIIFKPLHIATSVPTQQACQPLTFLKI